MSKPYVPTGTRTRFYVPPTLAADFTEFLDGDIPNQVMDFELLRDWYARTAEDYKKVTIRGELYADASKSRYANTDNNLNIRCDVNSGIQKGDYVIASNDGTIYLFDWGVMKESNNISTRALRCNCMLEFKRFAREITDDRAMLIEPEGWKTIAGPIPCNAYRYEGRPEFTAVSGQPGVTPNALTVVSVQYNTTTRYLNDGDVFVWGNDTYQIIDVGLANMEISGTNGVLTLQAKKAAGGMIEQQF